MDFKNVEKLDKVAGYSAWFKYDTKRIHKRKDGKWVLTVENGGFAGRRSKKDPKNSGCVIEIGPHDAFNKLSDWGVDEKFLERHFPQFMPAIDNE